MLSATPSLAFSVAYTTYSMVGKPRICTYTPQAARQTCAGRPTPTRRCIGSFNVGRAKFCNDLEYGSRIRTSFVSRSQEGGVASGRRSCFGCASRTGMGQEGQTTVYDPRRGRQRVQGAAWRKEGRRWKEA